jgi:hypothetical protein
MRFGGKPSGLPPQYTMSTPPPQGFRSQKQESNFYSTVRNVGVILALNIQMNSSVDNAFSGDVCTAAESNIRTAVAIFSLLMYLLSVKYPPCWASSFDVCQFDRICRMYTCPVFIFMLQFVTGACWIWMSSSSLQYCWLGNYSYEVTIGVRMMAQLTSLGTIMILTYLGDRLRYSLSCAPSFYDWERDDICCCLHSAPPEYRPLLTSQRMRVSRYLDQNVDEEESLSPSVQYIQSMLRDQAIKSSSSVRTPALGPLANVVSPKATVDVTSNANLVTLALPTLPDTAVPPATSGVIPSYLDGGLGI